MEIIDHIESATTLDVLESEESSKHVIVFTSVYLCRFEEDVSIYESSLSEAPRS